MWVGKRKDWELKVLGAGMRRGGHLSGRSPKVRVLLRKCSGLRLVGAELHGLKGSTALSITEALLTPSDAVWTLILWTSLFPDETDKRSYGRLKDRTHGQNHRCTSGREAVTVLVQVSSGV